METEVAEKSLSQTAGQNHLNHEGQDWDPLQMKLTFHKEMVTLVQPMALIVE